MVYLGGEVTNFQFLQPGAHHQARFMADCLYLLTMQMTRNMNPNLCNSSLKMLSQATDYIVYFHAQYFLKSPLAAQAPMNDLNAFKLCFNLMSTPEYKHNFGQVAKVLHNSLLRHCWYLAPQTVIFSLADEDLETEEKMEILNTLLSYDMPTQYEMSKPDSPIQICALSSISDFVTEESYLFFNLMNIEKDTIMTWKRDSLVNESYSNFCSYIKAMAVVNDRAERHIRLVQDFIGTSHDEDRFQDNLQVIHQNRKDISKNASKSDLNKL